MLSYGQTCKACWCAHRPAREAVITELAANSNRPLGDLRSGDLAILLGSDLAHAFNVRSRRIVLITRKGS